MRLVGSPRESGGQERVELETSSVVLSAAAHVGAGLGAGVGLAF